MGFGGQIVPQTYRLGLRPKIYMSPEKPMAISCAKRR